LTGFWAIDEKPTGSKDPFALRRAAVGVIRLLLENAVRLSLMSYLQNGMPKDVLLEFGSVAWGANEVSEQKDPAWFASRDLLSFFHDRLKVFLKDEGIRHDVIDACLAMDGADDITLLVKRARALSQTLATEDGKNLIQGFKRANNILSQAEAKDGVEYSYGPDIKFAEEDAEKALFAALDTAEAAIKPAMASEDFEGAMSAMAAMRGAVDAFFEAVQVNSDNSVVRRNRLNLLGRIRDICLSVADLTKLDG
jgi:glycyl-tRNA synthetase beta chain